MEPSPPNADVGVIDIRCDFHFDPCVLENLSSKLRSIALAEVLMKLMESCVIEVHIDKLLKDVELTNFGLGTPDAAALIVRIVRSWAKNMGGGTQGRAGCRRRDAN